MPQIKLTTPQFFSDVYYWKWDYPSILKADLQAIRLAQNLSLFFSEKKSVISKYQMGTKFFEQQYYLSKFFVS